MYHKLPVSSQGIYTIAEYANRSIYVPIAVYPGFVIGGVRSNASASTHSTHAT